MIAELGRFLIALALTATLAQIVLAWLGANRGGQGGLARAGEAAVRIAVFAAASAFLLLIVSFLRSDFSIAYVAGHSHVDKPLVYKIAAAWGGHEGSMLLWCLLLALFGFAISRIGPVDDALRLRAVSVQALLAFILSTLGAFLVRSGVLTSVHAFALDPERGVWILGMLALSAVGGFTLFALRAGSLGEGEGFEPTSREAFIGANNLLLAASAGVVLVGTIYPLIMEMAGGATVSVGAPYFNAAATPLMMAALVLLPLAPFLPWANGGAKPGLKQMRAAFLLLPMAIAGAVFLWFGAPVMAVIGGVIGVWVITGAAMDALSALPAAKTRALRWSASGRALAHAGAGFIALGAAADASRPPELTRALVPGETISHAGHTLTLESVRRADGPNYLADRAVLRLESGGAVRPERRFYPAADQNTREVDIRSRPSGDLYVAIGEPRPQPGGETGYEIRVAFHPLIWSLGLGALLIVAGGGLALAGRIAGPVMQRRRKAGETAAREVPA